MTAEEQVPPQQEAAPAAAEISRRVGAILDAVEREATRLREEARIEAAGYLDDARRRADDLVAERRRRISELSDELVAKSEAVIARLDDAAPVRHGFENLVRALGDAAERLAREAGGSDVEFGAPPYGTQHPAAAQHAQPRPVAQPHEGAATYRQGDAAARTFGDAQRQHRAPEPVHPARAPAAPGWRGLGGEPAPAQAAATASGWRQQDEVRMVAIQMAASGASRGAVREHLHRALGLGDSGPVLDDVFGPGSGEDARVPWAAGAQSVDYRRGQT